MEDKVEAAMIGIIAGFVLFAVLVIGLPM